MVPHYTCIRCKQSIDFSKMSREEKSTYFTYGFCRECQSTLNEEKD